MFLKLIFYKVVSFFYQYHKILDKISSSVILLQNTFHHYIIKNGKTDGKIHSNINFTSRFVIYYLKPKYSNYNNHIDYFFNQIFIMYGTYGIIGCIIGIKYANIIL